MAVDGRTILSYRQAEGPEDDQVPRRSGATHLKVVHRRDSADGSATVEYDQLVPADREEMDSLLHKVLDAALDNGNQLGALSAKIDAQQEVLTGIQIQQKKDQALLAEYRMVRRFGLALGAFIVTIVGAVAATSIAAWVGSKFGWSHS